MNTSTTSGSKAQTTEQKLRDLNASIKTTGVTMMMAIVTITLSSINMIQAAIVLNKINWMLNALLYVTVGLLFIVLVKCATYLISMIVERALIEHDRDKASA